MPTYEYRCDAGHDSEARQSMEDEPLERCPRDDCDAPARRQISLGGGLMIGGSSSPERGACGGSGFT